MQSFQSGKTIQNLTRGSIPKVLFIFTLPLLLTQILQQVFSLVDGMLIGQYAGGEALAAVGIAGLFLSVALNFFIGLSTGISVLTANLFGSRQYTALKQSITTALVIGGVAGSLLTLLGREVIPFYLEVLKTPEPIFTGAKMYLEVCCFGLIPQLIYQIGMAILRSLGNTRSALILLGITTLINVLLDVLFIFFGQMGIIGAALATLIAQWLLALLMINKLQCLPFEYRPSFSKDAVKLSLIPEMMRIGTPSGLQAIFMSLSSLVIQTYINGFGAAAIAGMSVFARIEGFLYFPAFSFGMAVTGFVGQNLGAKKPQRIRRGIGISILAAGVFTLVGSLLLMKFSNSLLNWFTNDPEVIRNGKQAVVTIFPLYFLYAINQVLIGAIRGFKKTGYPMIASLIAYCLVRILWCALLLPQFNDLGVVYTSYVISFVLLLGLLIFGYQRFCQPSYQQLTLSAATTSIKS